MMGFRQTDSGASDASASAKMAQSSSSSSSSSTSAAAATPGVGERRLGLDELRANLTCALCQGYLIDATTINECMHTCTSAFLCCFLFLRPSLT